MSSVQENILEKMTLSFGKPIRLCGLPRAVGNIFWNYFGDAYL